MATITKPAMTQAGRPGHSQYTAYLRARENQALVRRDRLAREVPRAAIRAVLVGLVLALVIGFGIGLPGLAVTVFLLLVVFWPGLVALAAFGVSPDVETLREAAEAEHKTARALSRLRRHGYIIMHDRVVPNAEGTIGHLLVGPGGVMVIASDTNKGTVRYTKSGAVCDGETLKPAIERIGWLGGEVRTQIRAAVPMVKIPVYPILAMVEANVLWSDGAVDGVTIINIKDVVNYVRGKAGRLNPGQIKQVAAAAERLFPAYSANRLAEQVTLDRDQWLLLMDALRTIRERDGDASGILDRLAQLEADLGRQADLINRPGMPVARAGEAASADTPLQLTKVSAKAVEPADGDDRESVGQRIPRLRVIDAARRSRSGAARRGRSLAAVRPGRDDSAGAHRRSRLADTGLAETGPGDAGLSDTGLADTALADRGAPAAGGSPQGAASTQGKADSGDADASPKRDA